MVSPRVKICGISSPDALDAAIDARAEFTGFNFYPRSPRFVGAGDVAALAQRASCRIGKVGVFVEPDDAMLGEMVTAAQLDAIQLHGKETPERAAQVRARYGLPVWKVLSVRNADDVARADAYAGAADFILFDAKTPDNALPGGIGLSFDWMLVANWKGPLEWGLAGGLTPDNVAVAIGETGAPLVDTSSGVESAPGVKDVDKIAAFCKAARNT